MTTIKSNQKRISDASAEARLRIYRALQPAREAFQRIGDRAACQAMLRVEGEATLILDGPYGIGLGALRTDPVSSYVPDPATAGKADDLMRGALALSIRITDAVARHMAADDARMDAIVRQLDASALEVA